MGSIAAWSTQAEEALLARLTEIASEPSRAVNAHDVHLGAPGAGDGLEGPYVHYLCVHDLISVWRCQPGVAASNTLRLGR